MVCLCPVCSGSGMPGITVEERTAGKVGVTCWACSGTGIVQDAGIPVIPSMPYVPWTPNPYSPVYPWYGERHYYLGTTTGPVPAQGMAQTSAALCN